MNPTATINYNQALSFPVTGQDVDGNPKGIVGTIQSSDHSKAFVATTPGNVGWVVPRITPPVGSSVVVSILLALKDANVDGHNLPIIQLDVTINGPAVPIPVPASIAVIGSLTVSAIDAFTPADPGAAAQVF